MNAVLPVTDVQDPDQLTLMFTSNGRQEDAEDEEDEEDWGLPYNPYGAIFLRTIMLIQVPRMRARGPTLTSTAFKNLFGKTEEEIIHKYYRVGIVPLQAVSSIRTVTNKTRRTTTFFPLPGSIQPDLFKLSAKNLTLPPPAVDGGSDMEDDESADEGVGIDKTVTQLYCQFILDMINKSPNPKGVTKPSYCVLDHEARLSVKEDVFKSPRLADVWRACQYKVCGKSDFKLAFNHLFPPRGHLTSPKVQNYLQCQYYMKWKEICANADLNTVDEIRSEIRKRVFDLVWLPHATQDRMWSTKHLNGFSQYPATSDVTAAAPRILIRQRPEF
jgi:hypothetical protein